MERKNIARYEIADYGVDHCQYFTGCSALFTDFDVVFVGAGMSESEALDDACDQAAVAGWNTDSIDDAVSDVDDVPVSDDEDDYDNELYHYVALYIA